MALQIPGLRILDRLAEGGSSFIYRAVDLRTSQPRAVKVLKAAARADTAQLRAFRAEAALLKSLHHENLLTVYDAGTAEGEEYTVLEFFDAGNVKRLLQQKSPDLARLALPIFHGAAEALCALHLQGIIHKDVKPENLLVSAAGRVKLIDLSIAEKPGMLSGLGFRKKTVQGTPSYMSPEQIQGKTLDHRTDVYSLGAAMYEVYTGAPPFIGRTQDEVLQLHLKGTPRRFRGEHHPVPTDVHDLILQMLSKDPALRPDMNIVLRRVDQAIAAEKARADRAASAASAGARAPGGMRKGVPRPAAPAPTTTASGGSPQREKRLSVQNARVTFVRVREARLSGQREGLDGFLTNLSSAGLGFDTAIPPELGEELDLVVIVPPLNRAQRLSGVVRWVSPNPANGLKSVGVQLPKPPPEYVQQLEELRKALSALA